MWWKTNPKIHGHKKRERFIYSMEWNTHTHRHRHTESDRHCIAFYNRRQIFEIFWNTCATHEADNSNRIYCKTWHYVCWWQSRKKSNNAIQNMIYLFLLLSIHFFLLTIDIVLNVSVVDNFYLSHYMIVFLLGVFFLFFSIPTDTLSLLRILKMILMFNWFSLFSFAL